MSANFEISDHGVFFRGPGARNPSYTMVNHGACKTYPKISNGEFLSKSLFLKLLTGRKIIIFFCSKFKVNYRISVLQIREGTGMI